MVLKNLISNISIIIFIAYFLSKMPLFKEWVLGKKDSLLHRLLMTTLFGFIGILATYIGFTVNGAIANARIIGVLIGGIYGGPWVGLGAGMIAGIHRWAIDIGGFAALACGLSTLVEGIIGGQVAKYIKNARYSWIYALVLGVLAEGLQMGIILLIAKPTAAAWELVRIIWAPMVLFNPVGIALFVGLIDGIYKEQEKEAALQTKLALDIVDESLGYLRDGLAGKGLHQVARIILNRSGVSAVALTDCQEIKAHAGLGEDHHIPGTPVKTNLTRQVIQTGRIVVANHREEIGCNHPRCQLRSAVIAPLRKRDEVIGTIKIYLDRENGISDLQITLATGLAKLFSTQLELVEIEYQRKLRQKAELKALQSQINPHFLFNALNTINSFCRIKPERARELLNSLSAYFRNTLRHSGDYFICLRSELKNINAYLELERARFEDRLQVILDIPEEIDCRLPQFILQPLVENAVKHGVLPLENGGTVTVMARKAGDETRITIEDSGVGIPPEIIRALDHDDLPKECIGLSNVNRRLKSIYGSGYALKIVRRACGGTAVLVRIPAHVEGDLISDEIIDY